MRTRSSLVCLVAALSALGSNASLAVPAFPGAEGFGAETPGGRGGQVLYVNTLDDHVDGQGCTPQDCTLREAIDTAGPRMVLFKVGGTIVLDTLPGPLVIDEPYITIAGHSAPGDGIEIRNNTLGANNLSTFHSVDQHASILIATHDVVLRHLRIRPGPLTPNPNCTHIGAVANPPSAPYGGTCVDVNGIKGIEIQNDATDIVLDHLSLSWASYLLALKGSGNVTLQHSILSEGLDYWENWGNLCRSEHPPEEWAQECPPYNGFLGMGFMAGNAETASQNRVTGPYTLHHNLFAHNAARNPQITVKCLGTSDPLACAADVVNNVTFNWKHINGAFGMLSGNALGHHFGNVVDNFFKVGPDSISVAKALSMVDYTNNPDQGVYVFPGMFRVHHSGNRSYVSGQPSAAVTPFCGTWNAQHVHVPCDPSDYAPDPDVPYATPEITAATDADQAYVDVLAQAGASLRLEADGSATFNRDPNDERVIANVLANAVPQQGGIISNYGEFPGFPTLAGASSYADSDGDGMPDTWETAQCLNPNVADHNGDPDGDVYTNIEEFLNGEDATPDHDEDGFPTGCDAACDDGFDNDGDQLVDLADPGCANNPAWPTENPACSNGYDDDQDNKTDYPADNGCASLGDTTEQNHCGMLGIEVVPVLLWAAFARRRRA